MTSDGTNTYTWDRTNRLLSMGGIAYAYDGLGNRVSQTESSIVTAYLNDVQLGLTKVLAQTADSDTTRFMHGPRGIQAMEDSVGEWAFPVQDGLGSVRGEIGANLSVNAMQNYAPYGAPFGTAGTFVGPFGFTGEQTDGNSQVYLRARYYNLDMGVFPSLDPVEGNWRDGMSLNRYGYIAGNPANFVDPSGMVYESPYSYDPCGMPRAQTDRCSCFAPGGLLEDPIWYRWCQFGYRLASCPNYDLIYPTPTATPQYCGCADNCSGCVGVQYTTCRQQCETPPIPTPNPAVTIFFGGSGYPGGYPASDLTDLEQFTRGQAPTWTEEAGGNVFPYNGSKDAQANSALGGFENSYILVIGYSAGADAAMLFANRYMQNNTGVGMITDIALIGGTMTAQDTNLATDWSYILDMLLAQGTDVYVLDDNAADDPNWASYNQNHPDMCSSAQSTVGSYCYESAPNLEHWDGARTIQEGDIGGANNSAEVRARILNWLRNN